MRKIIFIFLAFAIPLSIFGYIKLFTSAEFITVPNSSFKNKFINQPKDSFLFCVNPNDLATAIIKSDIKYMDNKQASFGNCPKGFKQIFITDTNIKIKNNKTLFIHGKKIDDMSNDKGTGTFFYLEPYSYKIVNEKEWKIHPGKEKEGLFKTYLEREDKKQLLNNEKWTKEMSDNIDDMVTILWYGDIDGDNKLDLAVSYKLKEDYTKNVLYLSTQGSGDDFVKAVRTTFTEKQKESAQNTEEN